MTAAPSAAEPARFRHGLILGKFMPMHVGHVGLIEAAAARCARLTVLVCSVRREPIAGALRYAWARAALAHLPHVTVRHVTDEVPSYPHESPDFWAIWVPLLRRETGPDLDVVFAGEAYGHELGARLGVAAVVRDRATTRPASAGTAVRQDPLTHWDDIVPPARPYFVRRVAVVGPESTGKTTLAAQLAAAFGTAWVPEFARPYLAGRPMADFSPADVAAIAAGQAALEAEALPTANRLLFCDTDALTTATWSALYFGGHVPPAVAHQVLTTPYDLTLLLAPDVPWTQDGTRESALLRGAHAALFPEWLAAAHRPWVLVEGTGLARLRAAVAAVEAAFGWPAGNPDR